MNNAFATLCVCALAHALLFPGAVMAGDTSADSQPACELRYCDNGDGTVTDTRSGLVWLKNASCAELGTEGTGKFQEAMLAASNISTGMCGLTDGSKPGDWRLPTRTEWLEMVDKRFIRPAISNAEGTAKWREGDAFVGVQDEAYWSGEPENGNDRFAWGAGLFGGVVVLGEVNIRAYIWPVRAP